MDVRVVTLRYHEGVQGFVEEALARATAGNEVREVAGQRDVCSADLLFLVKKWRRSQENPRERYGLTRRARGAWVGRSDRFGVCAGWVK